MEQLRVQALIGPLRTLGLPERSVNLFVSKNTLEHIGPRAVRELMIELRPLAAPAAALSHFIDMPDHDAHFNSGISEFNYMRYADPRWRMANNRLQYQNRLAASDSRRVVRGARFQLVSEDPERFRLYVDDSSLTLRNLMTAIAPDTP